MKMGIHPKNSSAIFSPASKSTSAKINPPRMNNIRIDRIPSRMSPVTSVIDPIMKGPITAANLPSMLKKP